MMKKITDPLIKGIGTDIIEIRRIRSAIERHSSRFLNRLFTIEEQNYCLKYKDPVIRFAGRFAAKEAILKALGTGLSKDIGWKEVEILNNNQGKPEVHVSGRLLTFFPKINIALSISHCQEYATATAIWIT